MEWILQRSFKFNANWTYIAKCVLIRHVIINTKHCRSQLFPFRVYIHFKTIAMTSKSFFFYKTNYYQWLFY